MPSKSKNTNKKHAIAAPPDGGYGWVVLAACFLISFAADGVMYSFGIALNDIRDHFNVGQDKANLLSSFNTGFLFCSGPIVSGLSNQLGIRPVVMGGALVTALMYASSAYLPSIYYIMVTYGIIGGISTGCTYIASLIIVAQYFDKLQGIATGITMAGSGVGSFAYAPITQIFIQKLGWQYTLIFFGATFLLCCFFGALLRPVPKKFPSDNEVTVPRDGPQSVQTFTGSVLSLPPVDDEDDDDDSCCQRCLTVSFSILKEMVNLSLLGQNFAFALTVAANFFLFTGYFIPFLYVPVRATELKIDNFALILSTIGIVNIPARLIFGFLADKRFLSPVNLNTLCVVLATATLWSYAFLTTFYTQIGFAVAFAIGIGGMNCLSTPYLKDLVGMEKFSNAMGILNLFRGFGCFLGPFLGGLISEQFTGSLAAFTFSAICFSVGTAFTLLLSIGIKLNLFKTVAKYTLTTTNAS